MNIYIDENEVQELLAEYKRCPQDESYYYHLANYIVNQVLNQLGLSLEGE